MTVLGSQSLRRLLLCGWQGKHASKRLAYVSAPKWAFSSTPFPTRAWLKSCKPFWVGKLSHPRHFPFRKTLEDPKVQETLDKFFMPTVYMNTADYTAYGERAFKAEKATIERLGLAKKT
jgi:hypothetical protein